MKISQAVSIFALLIRPLLCSAQNPASKLAIPRLRKRYRELFRQQIADTVADPGEVESELGFLATVLTRR